MKSSKGRRDRHEIRGEAGWEIRQSTFTTISSPECARVGDESVCVDPLPVVSLFRWRWRSATHHHLLDSKIRQFRNSLIIFLMSLLSPNTSLRFCFKWVLAVFFNIFQDTIGRHGVVHARLESLAVCQPRGLSPSSTSLIHSPASLSYSSSQLIVSTLFLFWHNALFCTNALLNLTF